MGTRWILEVACPQCGFEDDDVPFAPTCDFVTWKCPECGFVVDLMAMTGINYEEASNATEIADLCSLFGVIEIIPKEGGNLDLILHPKMPPGEVAGSYQGTLEAYQTMLNGENDDKVK